VLHNKAGTKIFYGWIMAICCMVMCTATSLCSSGMTTNLAAIKSAFDFTGAQTSLIVTVRSISALIFTVFAQKYYEFLGMRKGMVLAMLSGVLTFLIFAFAGSRLWMYYVGSVLAGITYAYGLMLPSSLLLRRWFNASIGIALAIASCGTGVVSIVFTPIIQLIINESGIKNAFLFQAGFMGITAILLALLVVEYPEDINLKIYGGRSNAECTDKQNAEKILSEKWVLSLVVATILVGMASSPAVSHFTLHYTNVGIDAMDVAKAISVYGIVLILSKLLLGKVIDKIGALKSTVLYSSVTAIGLIVVYLADFFPSIKWMYIGLIIFASSAVIQTLGYPNWISELDIHNYCRSVSRCQLGYQIGALAGSIIPGIIADETGSYGPAYLIFAVAMIISELIVYIVFKRNKPIE